MPRYCLSSLLFFQSMAQLSLYSSEQDSDAIQQRISDLRSQIRTHDYHYYVEARPVVSDREYDKLLEELTKLEREYPQYVTPDSPTQRVAGEPLKEFTQVVHERPMLSLANTYSREDVLDFDRRVSELLDTTTHRYVAELKYDGVAISLHYRNGMLSLGATRGNGEVGDDITQNIRTISSIPLVARLADAGIADLPHFEVRGEVYMLNDDFLALNEDRNSRPRELCQPAQPDRRHTQTPEPARSSSPATSDCVLSSGCRWCGAQSAQRWSRSFAHAWLSNRCVFAVQYSERCFCLY